ncbi:glycosyltransferase family 2 protein [Asticcacaulis sp. 201]|uniref:glycosyltransferase family 2 protein n=1 Tax=Asticcacaulis sp. 201 TaxID=3028787 RepID=UPI002915F3EA|nr:glycosyltransferase family 2 protein [Asticcacaulis sp. 201]MDV6331067.1 glycosyltransferase family 2 protein [Asticcacaulis sp. 201]
MNIAVIIASYNASSTIFRAVSSALNQEEVVEVIVVDDASMDDTVTVARAADDLSGRLKVLQLAENRGCSHARNVAIENSSAPYIAVLDSDDFFLPNRFKVFENLTNWDLVADNICFVPEHGFGDRTELNIQQFDPSFTKISLEDFITSNISRMFRPKAELGFLKPVMRRQFLDDHAVRYIEGVNFGEDYDLYSRCLGHGARFYVTNQCGYVAIERTNSLSSTPKTHAHLVLVQIDDALIEMPNLQSQDIKAIGRHREHSARKYRLRTVLDIKKGRGLRTALKKMLTSPVHFIEISTDILMDKASAILPKRNGSSDTRQLRYLLNSNRSAQTQTVSLDAR